MLGHFMLVFQIKEAGVQKGSLQRKNKVHEALPYIKQCNRNHGKKNTLFYYELTVFPTVLEKT